MAKIPEKFKNYTFNENDYLPEKYEVADKEKEERERMDMERGLLQLRDKYNVKSAIL